MVTKLGGNGDSFLNLEEKRTVALEEPQAFARESFNKDQQVLAFMGFNNAEIQEYELNVIDAVKKFILQRPLEAVGTLPESDKERIEELKLAALEAVLATKELSAEDFAEGTTFLESPAAQALVSKRLEEGGQEVSVLNVMREFREGLMSVSDAA